MTVGLTRPRPRRAPRHRREQCPKLFHSHGYSDRTAKRVDEGVSSLEQFAIGRCWQAGGNGQEVVMRRAGLVLIALVAFAAFVAVGDGGAQARPHFGALFGLLRAPFGLFHLRHHAYRHRSARSVIAGARRGYAPAAAGMAAGALASRAPGTRALGTRAPWAGPVFW